MSWPITHTALVHLYHASASIPTLIMSWIVSWKGATWANTCAIVMSGLTSTGIRSMICNGRLVGLISSEHAVQPNVVIGRGATVPPKGVDKPAEARFPFRFSIRGNTVSRGATIIPTSDHKLIRDMHRALECTRKSRKE